MTGHFQTQYGLGDRVLVLGIPARVFGIRITEGCVLYDVRFESGGAVGLHTTDEVTACQ